MPSGDLINGWLSIGNSFPAGLNSKLPATSIKLNETPDGYGIAYDYPGYLAHHTWSLPNGTAKQQTTKSIGGATCYWYYDRLWKFSGTTLSYGRPGVDDTFIPQGLGKLVSEATIKGVMSCLGGQLWVQTATGSYFMTGANDPRGYFELGQFFQDASVDFRVSDGVPIANTIDGLPVWCNDQGTFIYDGNKVTRLSENSDGWLGYHPTLSDPFSSSAVTSINIDHNDKLIVLRNGTTTASMIDMKTGQLFVYNILVYPTDAVSFRWTSPKIIQNGNYGPFSVESIVFMFLGYGTISWQTRTATGDWFNEPDIEIASNNTGRIEKEITNPNRNSHQFQVRITAMTSTTVHILFIKDVLLSVTNLSPGSFGE